MAKLKAVVFPILSDAEESYAVSMDIWALLKSNFAQQFECRIGLAYIH